MPSGRKVSRQWSGAVSVLCRGQSGGLSWDCMEMVATEKNKSWGIGVSRIVRGRSGDLEACEMGAEEWDARKTRASEMEAVERTSKKDTCG